VSRETPGFDSAIQRGIRAEWLSMSDAALLADCSRDDLSGGGSGGQKRDRKYSGIRLSHRPSGISVVSTVSRSRRRNESDALSKLRMALALNVRCEPPEDVSAVSAAVSSNARLKPSVVADIFDILDVNGYRLGDVARSIGVSTGRLTKVLSRDKAAWRRLSEIRAARGGNPDSNHETHETHERKHGGGERI